MVSRPQNNPRQQKPSRPQDAQGAPRGQQSRPKKQQGAPPAKSVRNTGSGAARSPGSGVGAHVDAFIGQHVSSHIRHQIDGDIKQDIRDQARSHLGEEKNKQTEPTATTSHGSAAAGDLLSALRSPQGVRQAILIAEVLGKPKALRR